MKFINSIIGEREKEREKENILNISNTLNLLVETQKSREVYLWNRHVYNIYYNYKFLL